MDRLSIDRKHSLAGRDNLNWFFANRKWLRTSAGGDAPRCAIIECAWAKRPLAEGEAGIRFLFLASKKSYKRAHDRNKIRRWLRAAITETTVFAELEASMLTRGEQLLVMMRVSKPMREIGWKKIRENIESIASHLAKRVQVRS